MIHARIDHALIRTPVAWPLRIMTAIIVFLAGMALISAWSLALGATKLDQDLRGQLTIELPPNEDGTIAAEKTAALVAVLEKLDGVIEVKPLTNEDAARLLRPWLGAETADASKLSLLPLPQLIDVQVRDSKVVAAINTLLRKKFTSATLTDHQLWLEALADKARLAATALLGLVGLMLLALFSTVIFACRAGLNVQKPTVTLLHILGATDDHICRQMQRYAWRLVWPGCLLGVVACVGAAMALRSAAHTLLPQQSVDMTESFWVGASLVSVSLPLLTLLFAGMSANLATRRVLQALP